MNAKSNAKKRKRYRVQKAVGELVSPIELKWIPVVKWGISLLPFHLIV